MFFIVLTMENKCLFFQMLYIYIFFFLPNLESTRILVIPKLEDSFEVPDHFSHLQGEVLRTQLFFAFLYLYPSSTLWKYYSMGKDLEQCFSTMVVLAVGGYLAMFVDLFGVKTGRWWGGWCYQFQELHPIMHQTIPPPPTKNHLVQNVSSVGVEKL